MSITRNQARQLAKNGMESGARVLRGLLTIKGGEIRINNQNVVEWLAEHADTEVILVAAPVGHNVDTTEVKTCYTCGREYTADTCPRCARVRDRLRG